MHSPTPTIRLALWAAAGVNAAGAALFGWIAVGGRTGLVPVPPQPFYAAQLALVIALFGGVYAWLARRQPIDRPLLVVGALGKLGFFALTATYAAAGHLPATMAVSATPDLVLGAGFLLWAWTSD
ncbi:MAG: hypothetical protein AB7O28_20280 [Vicinamibacterales bacterium]